MSACVKCTDALPAGGMCPKCVNELAREWGRQMVEACAEVCEAERDRHELPGGQNDELRFIRMQVRSALESCAIRIRTLSPVCSRVVRDTHSYAVACRVAGEEGGAEGG